MSKTLLEQAVEAMAGSPVPKERPIWQELRDAANRVRAEELERALAVLGPVLIEHARSGHMLASTLGARIEWRYPDWPSLLEALANEARRG